jgi:hypothetical protein
MTRRLRGGSRGRICGCARRAAAAVARWEWKRRRCPAGHAVVVVSSDRPRVQAADHVGEELRAGHDPPPPLARRGGVGEAQRRRSEAREELVLDVLQRRRGRQCWLRGGGHAIRSGRSALFLRDQSFCLSTRYVSDLLFFSGTYQIYVFFLRTQHFIDYPISL